VIDPNCWLGKGARGPNHRTCAVACANLNTPLAILTDDGSVVWPVLLTAPTGPKPNNDKLIPFAETRVSVTGQVIDRGKERAIVLSDIKNAAEPAVAPTFADKENPDTVLTAQVADLNCWLGQGAKGAGHRDCAIACAKLGQPLVLLTDDGYIYYPVVKTMPSGPAGNDMLMAFAEQRVNVKGTMIQRGNARAFIIESVAAAQ
jgi:hypothetical protein